MNKAYRKGLFMLMKPGLRRFALTAHIAFSVGWLGAVAAFLALALAGLFNQNAQMVRAAYFAMQLIGWYVVVPLCLASLLTGLVQSLGTKWGLFRHYWVLTKFVITVFSALILFGFTQTLGSLENLAADTTLSIDELRNLGQSPVVHSGGGLLALLVTTFLSVYKPWGLTGYGRRKQGERIEMSQSASLSAVPNEKTAGGLAAVPWGFYVLIGLGGLVLLFLIAHLASGGSGQHGH
jgi:hypothetical protein